MKPLSNLINLAALVVILCSFVGRTMAQVDERAGEISVLDLPILSQDTSAARNFWADAFCSETKLRTGVVLLSWKADENSFDNQRLDVTIYKKGFDKNLYTSLWPLETGQEFQTSSQVKLSDRPSNQALYLNVNKIDVDKKKRSISVELEGLEAGLNYYWRVLTLNEKGWVLGGIIRTEAPICPADIIEEANKRQ